MAKVNRKTGTVSGKIGKDVYFKGRGKQLVRRRASRITIRNTAPLVELKAVFGELSSMWRELPENIKALWELFASQQGSASEVESNEPVTYKYCPIPSYPPRPKLLSGVAAFISANIRAFSASMKLPLLEPPIGLSVPPPPDIDCRYDHSTGELIVSLDTPDLGKARNGEIIKVVMWITAYRANERGSIFMARKRKIDAFDIPAAPTRIEKRYSGIKFTQKYFGYKPIRFADFPYIRIYIGCQIVLSPASGVAPVVSSGAYMPYWIFNDTRYIAIEDLFGAGEFKNPGQLRFNEHFNRLVRERRHKLAQKKFVSYRLNETV